MHSSFLAIKNKLLPFVWVLFFALLNVDNFVICSALLISLFYLSLQIVGNSFFNISFVSSAKSNLPPKALDFQGLLLFNYITRLINC